MIYAELTGLTIEVNPFWITRLYAHRGRLFMRLTKFDDYVLHQILKLLSIVVWIGVQLTASTLLFVNKTTQATGLASFAL